MRRIAAAVTATIIACFLGFLAAFSYSSIDSPPVITGEEAALIMALIINSFWLIIAIVHFTRNKNKREVRKSILLFIIVLLPFLYMRFYRTKFEQGSWKTAVSSIHYTNQWIHENGPMVPYIIESRLLIGLSKEKVIRIMGDKYSTLLAGHPSNDFFYTYTNSVAFDPCSEIQVHFENDICVSVNYFNCD